MGYQVIVIDSTMINLSQKRFKYATYRITRPRGLRNVGAKINISIDSFHAFPLHHLPTQAHEHDSKHMDSFVQKLLTTRKKWFNLQVKNQLKPFLVFDKGYWKEERFWRWSQQKIFFLCPKRQRTFTRAQFEILEFPKPSNQPLDINIWRESHSFPLRWILKLESSAHSKRWEVITNNLEIDANRIFQLYSHRWPIEEVFKWLKQHLCLEKPTTNSRNGFLIHLYFVLILFLLLLFFLFLIGCQRWQNHLTDLWLQLRFSPLEPWWMHRLKPSFTV